AQSEKGKKFLLSRFDDKNLVSAVMNALRVGFFCATDQLQTTMRLFEISDPRIFSSMRMECAPQRYGNLGAAVYMSKRRERAPPLKIGEVVGFSDLTDTERSKYVPGWRVNSYALRGEGVEHRHAHSMFTNSPPSSPEQPMVLYYGTSHVAVGFR
ncbi:unnamed protein product, partial [Amoebophrya sp. A25]